MYISKLFIRGFRSFKEATIHFSERKNVIVGKNNCGKSNIVRALDMLVGEKYPTYLQITDNDFYTTVEPDKDSGEMIEYPEDNMFIEVTLGGRDINEELINSMIKSVAFSKVKNIKAIYHMQDNELWVNYDLLQNLDVIAENDAVVAYESNKKSRWIKPENLYDFLTNAKYIKIFFCKSRLIDDSQGFGMIIGDEGGVWISQFVPKKVRDSLLTSTAINAFRSPKDDLRVVSYTWFGKLITKIWDENKYKVDEGDNGSYIELILDQSRKMKVHVDKLFLDSSQDITKVIGRAITHNNVSFKLYNDSAHDLYKNVQIFINDGIDRPITEKGTGIQSAVIIALFSLYCNKFHTTSSLLITEEPEIFLHPQARRIISAELDLYLKGSDRRQLIINTHSTEFLKGVDPVDIIRVYKDSGQSCVAQLPKGKGLDITQEMKRFLWSNNTEIFFCDSTILVEGGECYLLPPILDRLKDVNQYLDYNNVSVARVNGKGNFLTYIKMLDAFKITWILIGDLDCYLDVVGKVVGYLREEELVRLHNELKKTFEGAALDSKKLSDRLKGIASNFDAQRLATLFKQFKDGVIERDDKELTLVLEEMTVRNMSIDVKAHIQQKFGNEKFIDMQSKLRAKNMFIWSNGALEDYFTDKAKEVGGRGKDLTALELSYILSDKDSLLEDYITDIEEWKLLSTIV